MLDMSPYTHSSTSRDNPQSYPLLTPDALALQSLDAVKADMSFNHFNPATGGETSIFPIGQDPSSMMAVDSKLSQPQQFASPQFREEERVVSAYTNYAFHDPMGIFDTQNISSQEIGPIVYPAASYGQ